MPGCAKWTPTKVRTSSSRPSRLAGRPPVASSRPTTRIQRADVSSCTARRKVGRLAPVAPARPASDIGRPASCVRIDRRVSMVVSVVRAAAGTIPERPAGRSGRLTPFRKCNTKEYPFAIATDRERHSPSTRSRRPVTMLPGYEGLSPRYGDLHNHCALSYGAGSPEDALRNARLQLDFVSLTVHGAWPDVPRDDPDLGYLVAYHERGFERAREGWSDYLALTDAANEPGRFVTLPSFEWHSMAYGDHCAYFKNGTGTRIVDAPDLPSLRTAVRAMSEDVMLVPHHIGYQRGHRGIDWDAFDGASSPVAEIVSFHGSAESCDGPVPARHGPASRGGNRPPRLEAGAPVRRDRLDRPSRRRARSVRLRTPRRMAALARPRGALGRDSGATDLGPDRRPHRPGVHRQRHADGRGGGTRRDPRGRRRRAWRRRDRVRRDPARRARRPPRERPAAAGRARPRQGARRGRLGRGHPRHRLGRHAPCSRRRPGLGRAALPGAPPQRAAARRRAVRAAHAGATRAGRRALHHEDLAQPGLDGARHRRDLPRAGRGRRDRARSGGQRQIDRDSPPRPLRRFALAPPGRLRLPRGPHSPRHRRIRVRHPIPLPPPGPGRGRRSVPGPGPSTKRPVGVELPRMGRRSRVREGGRARPSPLVRCRPPSRTTSAHDAPPRGDPP